MWWRFRSLAVLLCAAAAAVTAHCFADAAQATGPQSLRLDTGEEVELAGIRAPDAHHPGGAHAQEYLAFLIRGRALRIERSEQDPDERGGPRRAVWARREGERDLLNREMVLGGYAAAYVTRAREPEAASLVQAEIEARAQRRGLWAIVRTPERFIGNPRSRIFHSPDCPALPTLRHAVLFQTRNQAVRCYFRPCRLCLPF
jgi:Staphylococcal nuclease homologue/Metal binding domain of Ada